jgi:hypothetical protein
MCGYINFFANPLPVFQKVPIERFKMVAEAEKVPSADT